MVERLAELLGRKHVVVDGTARFLLDVGGQSLVEGTSGGAGGTHSEILSWTLLVLGQCQGRKIAVPIRTASARFFIVDPPGMRVRQIRCYPTIL